MAYPSDGFLQLHEDDLIIDQFCGAGGASKGLESGLRKLGYNRHVDIAINHCASAIDMHTVNHPHTLHLQDSVWEVNPQQTTGGKDVGIMWLSPDCTHFSRAKNATPRKQHIRGLAWVLVKWAALTRVKCWFLENVQEMTTWGLLNNGKPCIAQRGVYFDGFCLALTTGLPAKHPAWKDVYASLFRHTRLSRAQKLTLYKAIAWSGLYAV